MWLCECLPCIHCTTTQISVAVTVWVIALYTTAPPPIFQLLSLCECLPCIHSTINHISVAVTVWVIALYTTAPPPIFQLLSLCEWLPCIQLHHHPDFSCCHCVSDCLVYNCTINHISVAVTVWVIALYTTAPPPRFKLLSLCEWLPCIQLHHQPYFSCCHCVSDCLVYNCTITQISVAVTVWVFA